MKGYKAQGMQGFSTEVGEVLVEPRIAQQLEGATVKFGLSSFFGMKAVTMKTDVHTSYGGGGSCRI